MRNGAKLWSLAILFSVAAGCGSTNSTIVFHEEALRGDTDALVYVFRESALLGGAVPWNLYLDGHIAGVLKQGAYMTFHLTPGQHSVRVGDSSPDLVHLAAEAIANNPEAFIAKAGQTYYIRSHGSEVAFLTHDQAMPSLGTMKYDTGQ
jgi:hypothetical protein